MDTPALFNLERGSLHELILQGILTVDSNGVASNSDKKNAASIEFGMGMADRMRGQVERRRRLKGQTAGAEFEVLVADYVKRCFSHLNHMRPGKWDFSIVSARRKLVIAGYEQYRHLLVLAEAAQMNPQLAAALGSDYLITPDIVVSRRLESDDSINQNEELVDKSCANLASLREASGGLPIMHANISCKWTLRSDRAQNARSEALNLVRNRKGPMPHVVVVTAEPLPSRIASIALGTGDLDCTYHLALPELMAAVEYSGREDALEMLGIMIDGDRLKDISDLPLDLAV